MLQSRTSIVRRNDATLKTRKEKCVCYDVVLSIFLSDIMKNMSWKCCAHVVYLKKMLNCENTYHYQAAFYDIA